MQRKNNAKMTVSLNHDDGLIDDLSFDLSCFQWPNYSAYVGGKPPTIRPVMVQHLQGANFVSDERFRGPVVHLFSAHSKIR